VVEAKDAPEQEDEPAEEALEATEDGSNCRRFQQSHTLEVLLD
jgi:hypothetical protein